MLYQCLKQIRQNKKWFFGNKVEKIRGMIYETGYFIQKDGFLLGAQAVIRIMGEAIGQVEMMFLSYTSQSLPLKSANKLLEPS